MKELGCEQLHGRRKGVFSYRSGNPSLPEKRRREKARSVVGGSRWLAEV